jgi:hypothetical protein
MSNTEQMVSVPRDEVERLVKLLQYQAHPYPSPHAEFWQGLLDAPAAQHQGDVIEQQKNLIASLRAELVESYRIGAQHQGEPVAWAVFERGHIADNTTDPDLARQWIEGGADVAPLYIHPPTTNVLARSTPQTKARLIDSFGREL